MLKREYIDLRVQYLTQGQVVSVGIQELATFWHISNKQVQRRLQLYATEKLLIYKPGHGRGHLSRLTFLHDFREEITTAMAEAMRHSDHATILYLFQLAVPSSWLADYRQIFTNSLGIQTTQANKRILRQIMTRPITTLDPVAVSIYHEYRLVLQLGDTLLNYDKILKPGLAHHWQSDDAKTVWTFYLRKGVQFHNGKLMTAVDVKNTFERVRQQLGETYWQLVNLKNITVIAPDVIQFEFKESEPLFPRFITDAKYVIIDCDVPFDAVKWIGTGAFQISEQTATTLKLKAFDHYFGFRAMIDEVEYLITDNMNIAEQLFNPEDYGYFNYIKKNRVVPGAEFIIANLKRKSVIQNPLVRAALYDVIDMRFFDQKTGTIASHYDKLDTVVDTEKSLQRAKKRLKQANYANEPIVLATLAHIKPAQDMADWIQKRAQQIGINLQVITFNFHQDYYTDFLEKEADLVMLADIPMNPDLFSYLEFITNPTLLIQKMLLDVQRATLQEMVMAFKQARSEDERHDIYLQIDNWLVDQNILIYTIHAIREVYIHQFLANDAYEFDYKNAW